MRRSYNVKNIASESLWLFHFLVIRQRTSLGFLLVIFPLNYLNMFVVLGKASNYQRQYAMNRHLAI